MPIKIFFSYARKDKALRDELANHLALLRNQDIIADWHDCDIDAGEEWATEIDQHLNEAHLILLLVSADFMASKYCYALEMKRAMERHEGHEAKVIPVILRACDWRSASFGKLNALPSRGKPVTKWGDRDEAFTNIVEEIRCVAEKLNPNP